MDFLPAAERAAAVVNGAPADLTAFAAELRPVFEAGSSGDDQGAVDLLNGLLARHPVRPGIAGADGDWRLAVANPDGPEADTVVAESLLALTMLVCDLGPHRLGVCAAGDCEDAYIDASPNASRRYCSERCSSRSNVAAFRARQRDEATA
ncbi:MAG: CGNR zinc finger domain-containing protein [Nocardioides sp.]|nr:CGNR zinc finger domain-containing protein [Nocardioides sp.]